jgi:DNA-binding response OmpR family regulator
MGLSRIVVAEDDAAIRELLVHHLQREGFRCEEASDGPAALRLARSGADLLVLDLGLPAVDGFEIVRMLRREGRALPILVLTARNEEVDRVVGLELGADDYVTKPFSPREVVARVKAIGRRSGGAPTRGHVLLTFDRLEIDEAAREARVDGVDVGLKPREFALLLELATNAGVALSRTALLEHVWGYDFAGDERTVDVHVRRLRLTLEERARLGPPLQTVHGFGYLCAILLLLTIIS